MSNEVNNNKNNNNRFVSFPNTDWLMNLCFSNETQKGSVYLDMGCDIVILSFMSCSIISDCITMCPRYIHYTIGEDKEKNIINFQPI